MLGIGPLILSSPLILAPLSGISDLPFRLINRSFGCELAFTEMISARSLLSESRRTAKMLTTLPEDRPLGVQLLGEDPEVMKRALDLIAHCRFDVIDLNAACPVPKVTRRGEGSGLLSDPLRLRDLLRVIVSHTAAPVTVKIRAGRDETSLNAVDVALHAQDAGIAALFIHGRTGLQGYRGSVDYHIIRRVKEALSIPVIASGDVLNPELLMRMFTETGCDGVIIARGALGNPWIFRQSDAFLNEGGPTMRPGLGEITSTMRQHLELCCDFYGERRGTMIFRKFFAWYARGIPRARLLKEQAFRASTAGVMGRVIDALTSEEKLL